MEHTKEPWEWSEHKFNAPPFEGTLDNECGIYPPDGEIGPVAIASGKNDARRIVACVNACAGVTTEELEQGGFVTGLIERLEEAPRWRDVVDELPQEAQEVLFVRGGKTVHGAWIGGIFWHSNQKMAAATWMPLPMLIPSMCGTVRRKPKLTPLAASIRLFGPGVTDIVAT